MHFPMSQPEAQIKPAKPKCQKCFGTGKLQDNAKVGDTMRKLRLKCGLTLKDVADQMDKHASYVCDLELGKRDWNLDLKTRFEQICNAR